MGVYGAFDGSDDRLALGVFFVYVIQLFPAFDGGADGDDDHVVGTWGCGERVEGVGWKKIEEEEGGGGRKGEEVRRGKWWMESYDRHGEGVLVLRFGFQ